MAAGIVNLLNLYLVILHFAGHAVSQKCGSLMDILAVAYGNGFTADSAAQRASCRSEYPGFGIGVNLSQLRGRALENHPAHHPRLSRASFFNAHNLRFIEIPFRNFHHAPGIGIADSVAQRAEVSV